MKLHQPLVRLATVGLLAVALAGCASHQSRKTSNTLMGAGLGAAAGAVVTGGDPLYTLGGAAAGGLLGNILTEERKGGRSKHWKGSERRHKHHDRRRR